MRAGTAFGLVKVTTAKRDVLLGDLESRIKTSRGFGVVTKNLDHVVKLRRDPAFRSAYERQTHIVADGNPVVWLHRLAGRPVDLITGSDLVEPLMQLAQLQKVPVAFFGSSQAALDTAAERLIARYPGLDIVARLSPALGFDPAGAEADQAIGQIAASGARLCLVALSAPKQELFTARAMERLPQSGFVGVGAGLDFIAGTQRRAPLWWRRMALEWLWRLVGDYGRFAGRYLDCALIFPELAIDALRERFGERSAAGNQPAAEFHVTTRPVEPVESGK